MKFNKETILKVADLAKLKLDEKEIKLLSQELSSISDFVEKLNDLKLDLNQSTDLEYISFENFGRDDEVISSSKSEKDLSLNQQKRQADLVIAPKIN